MKKWIIRAGLSSIAFTSLHTYLWAFGILEPKYDWFGGALGTAYGVGFCLLLIGSQMEERS
jgi:hypothetical protein